MKPHRILLVVLTLTLVLAGPVAAQAPQPRTDPPGLTGDQRYIPFPDRPTEPPNPGNAEYLPGRTWNCLQLSAHLW